MVPLRFFTFRGLFSVFPGNIYLVISLTWCLGGLCSKVVRMALDITSGGSRIL